MIKTIHKWFWVWDFDKEEAWLNRMAAQGLALRSVGFARYDFDETEPGAYAIRLDMPDRKSGTSHQQYIRFLEETGAEHAGSFNRWLYFRKKGDPDFALFSDNSSRIELLTRVIRLLLLVGGVNLYIGAYNLFLYAQFHSTFNLAGLISLALAGLSFVGAIRLHRKRKALRAEQQIFE